MKKITLKRSLELCAELWSWLRDNPDETYKNNWPKWNRYKNVDNNCFACHYDELEGRKRGGVKICSFCPLKELWSLQGYCMEKSSPFNKWLIAKTNKSRQKYAGIIVNFCEKELEKLKNKKGV